MADLHGEQGDGWIGVDLDGTLAFYDYWRGPEQIGKPIPRMVQRVEKWLKDGKTICILTARMSPGKDKGKDGVALKKAMVRRRIHAWLKENVKGGEKIKHITHEKDPRMVEIWDDRAIQVEPNTGKRVDGR